MSEASVVLCTVPDETIASRLAKGLVEARLAACVTFLGGITSVYHWKGELHSDKELELLIKTKSSLVPEVAAWIKQNHPYEVPEVIALPVQGGFGPYLAWVAESTKS